MMPIMLLLLLCSCQCFFPQVPGLETVEAMVRVLRVLRVFRLFRVGRRLYSEVQGRLLMLAATMFALTVTAAAFFYEIETRFGVSVLSKLCWGWVCTMFASAVVDAKSQGRNQLVVVA
jgi:hypothetical protein